LNDARVTLDRLADSCEVCIPSATSSRHSLEGSIRLRRCSRNDEWRDVDPLDEWDCID
jgi:hypothetical protein